MVKGHLTASLRAALALFGIAGIMLLAGCGGGNGAPNNPYTPPPPVIPPLTVLPGAVTVYAGTPATLTISGRRLALSRVLERRHHAAGGHHRIRRHDRARGQ